MTKASAGVQCLIIVFLPPAPEKSKVGSLHPNLNI
jgi:hypothetical protein